MDPIQLKVADRVWVYIGKKFISLSDDQRVLFLVWPRHLHPRDFRKAIVTGIGRPKSRGHRNTQVYLRLINSGQQIAATARNVHK